MLLQPPMNEVVHWNANEGVIGVVGVAPAATADFYAKLIRLTPVRKDWEHVRVLLDSNPKIPSRGRYFELGETDPVPFIRQSIEGLMVMGATIIAVPCNTAHILYKRYTKDLSVLVPNMIEVTARAVFKACKKIPQTVAVFASRLTQEFHLYNEILGQNKITVLDTAIHQEEISALIEKVKQGLMSEILKYQLGKIFSAYIKADAFIIGCTELSLLIQDNFNGIPIIDSNTALAESCLALSQNRAFCQHHI